MFGYFGSTNVGSDLMLAGGSVAGFEFVGGLAGEYDGVVRHASTSEPVTGAIGIDSTGDAAGGDFIGGPVGLNTGIMDGGVASGAVTGLSTVGGLVGANLADPGVAIIEYSHASGAVVETGGGLAGGSVGQSTTSATRTPTLVNGSVTGAGGGGGLVGDVNSGLIQASYATGSVVAVSPTYPEPPPAFGGVADVGGLIGYIGQVQATTLVDDYATSSVSGATQVDGRVKGIHPAGSFYLATVTLTNVYATGNVSGDSSVGGLIGYNEAAISGAYATGAVNGPSCKATQAGGLIGVSANLVNQGSATGAVSGNVQIGGLVGYNVRTVQQLRCRSGRRRFRQDRGQIRCANRRLCGRQRSRPEPHCGPGAADGVRPSRRLAGANAAGGTISSSYAMGAVAGASGASRPYGRHHHLPGELPAGCRRHRYAGRRRDVCGARGRREPHGFILFRLALAIPDQRFSLTFRLSIISMQPAKTQACSLALVQLEAPVAVADAHGLVREEPAKESSQIGQVHLVTI